MINVSRIPSERNVYVHNKFAHIMWEIGIYIIPDVSCSFMENVLNLFWQKFG